jgi:hypothetical protein
LIAIWGDSYAASFYPGLAYFSRQRGFDVAQFTASSCPPMIGYHNPDRRFCAEVNDFVVKRLAELKPDTVILYATWKYNDIPMGIERTVSLLKSANISKILMVGPPPSWLGNGLPNAVLDYYFEHHAVLPERTFFRSEEKWTRDWDEYLEREAKRIGVDYISAHRLMCDDAGCLARIGPDGSQLTTFDVGHLSYPASIMLAEQVLKAAPGFDR